MDQSSDYQTALRLLRSMARRRSNMPPSWASMDVAQAVALKVIRADQQGILASPKTPEHRGYLAKAVRSVISEYWRERYRRQAAEEKVLDDWSEESHEQPDGALYVLESFAELMERVGKRHSDPDRLERVVMLHFVEGRSLQEVATAVSAPKTAVWRDVQLARRFLEKRLRSHGFPEAEPA